MEELIFDFDMKVSAVILALTFTGIFTEHIHGFHRAKVAMLGAGSMALVGQYFGFSRTDEHRSVCCSRNYHYLDYQLYRKNHSYYRHDLRCIDGFGENRLCDRFGFGRTRRRAFYLG